MSLSDLSDAPLSDRPTLSDTVRDYLDYVKDLADETDVYGFAATTLNGIAETIAATGKVTAGQRTAVRNIVSGAAERRESRVRSRRYEGWTRNG